MEERRESALAIWSAPQCPVTAQYSRRTLGEIRAAVMDAFFSLPHGGVEIGGVLLGAYENGLLRVTGWAPVACEHASGPSFTLSGRDHDLLGHSLEQLRRNPPSSRPVGWCHSHHRSGIALRDADREIHRRYFPEPWQTALVVRPYPMEPAKGVFFFPSAEGFSDRDAIAAEFELELLATPPPPVPLQPDGQPARLSRRSAPYDIPPRPLPGFDRPAEQDAPAPVPKFLLTQPESPSRRGWLRVLMSVALCAALGGGVYATRSLWRPPLSGLTPSQPPAPDVGLGLNTIDLAGQLQIRWNREAPAVAEAVAAVLEIAENGPPERAALDAIHLKTGVFTYARHSERVDVTLTLLRADGRKTAEATTFLGALPPGIAPEEPLSPEDAFPAEPGTTSEPSR